MKVTILFVIWCGGALAINHQIEYKIGNQELNSMFDPPEDVLKAMAKAEPKREMPKGSKKGPITSVLITLNDLGNELMAAYQSITTRNVELGKVFIMAMKRIQFAQAALTIANIADNFPDGAEDDWVIGKLVALEGSARKIKATSNEFFVYCESIIDQTCGTLEEDTINEKAKQVHSAIQEALYHALLLGENAYGQYIENTFTNQLSQLVETNRKLNAISSEYTKQLVLLMNAFCKIGEKIGTLAANEWEENAHKILVLIELNDLFAFFNMFELLDETTTYLSTGLLGSVPNISFYDTAIEGSMPTINALIAALETIADFIADEPNSDISIEKFRIFWGMLFEWNHCRFVFEELIGNVLYGLRGQWQNPALPDPYRIADDYNFIQNYQPAIERTKVSHANKWDTMYVRMAWAWRYIGHRFATTPMPKPMKAFISKCTQNLQFVQTSKRIHGNAYKIARSVKINMSGNVGKCKEQFELLVKADILLEKIVKAKKSGRDRLTGEDKEQMKTAFQAIFTHMNEMIFEAFVFILQNKPAANAMAGAIAVVATPSFDQSLASQLEQVNAYNDLGKAFDVIRGHILKINIFYDGQVRKGNADFLKNIQLNTTCYVMLSELFYAYNLSKVYKAFGLINQLLEQNKVIEQDYIMTAMIRKTIGLVQEKIGTLEALVNKILQALQNGDINALEGERLMWSGEIYMLNEINDDIADVIFTILEGLWKNLTSPSAALEMEIKMIYEEFSTEFPNSTNDNSLSANDNSDASVDSVKRTRSSDSRIIIAERSSKRRNN